MMKARTIILITGLFLTGCGTTKSLVKSDTTVHTATTAAARINTDKTTDTQTYGGTLRGSNFIPQTVLPADSNQTMDEADSIDAESTGIHLKIKIKPKRNKQGTFIGNQVDYTATAKPIATTSTHEAQHSSVSTTNKTDSTARVRSVTKKTGWGLPSWVWWLAGIILLVISIVVWPILTTFIKRFIP